MADNIRLSYVLSELAKVDLFSEKDILQLSYDIILTIKRHIILEFLENTKIRMDSIDHDLFWADFWDEEDREDEWRIEFESLDRFSDVLMSLTDCHGSQLLEDGAFEKYVSSKSVVIDYSDSEFDVEIVDPDFDWDD
uniref:Uncharacterized protein n=1 Tax=viral metagenome TaxID=1070528 RepID=A0A6C0BCB0_9ZZZZ